MARSNSRTSSIVMSSKKKTTERKMTSYLEEMQMYFTSMLILGELQESYHNEAHPDYKPKLSLKC